MKERVLFLCTHNSARSQMAEAFLRQMGGNRFEVHSAGTQETALRVEAVETMRKYGIDISAQRSKSLEQFLKEPWDYVITVCDAANEACPYFPGGKQRLHWGFDDPSATSAGDRQRVFDRVGREIKHHLEEWLNSTDDEENAFTNRALPEQTPAEIPTQQR